MMNSGSPLVLKIKNNLARSYACHGQRQYGVSRACPGKPYGDAKSGQPGTWRRWSMAEDLQMTLECDTAEVARVLDAMEAFGEAHEVPLKATLRFNLVLDELITNIISYGFDDGSAGRIDVGVAFDGDILRAELTDNGRAFNPAEADLPELADNLEERSVGGLGLRLIRTYLDRLDYQRDGALNRLQIEMNVNAPAKG
jgi:anti-sigma regulatory factor (Ser/Thr protein kinase)